MLQWWNDKATNHIFRPAAFPQTQKGDNQQVALLVQKWSVDTRKHHSLCWQRKMRFPFYWKEILRQGSRLQCFQIRSLNRQGQVCCCHYMVALHKQDHGQFRRSKRLLQTSVDQFVKDIILGSIIMVDSSVNQYMCIIKKGYQLYRVSLVVPSLHNHILVLLGLKKMLLHTFVVVVILQFTLFVQYS